MKNRTREHAVLQVLDDAIRSEKENVIKIAYQKTYLLIISLW